MTVDLRQPNGVAGHARKPTRTAKRRSTADSVDRRLRSWFRTAEGMRLLAAERGPLSSAARSLHGNALLWMGGAELVEVTDECLVRVTVCDSEGCHCRLGRLAVILDPATLPFAAASLDGVILHHVLDEVAEPRAVLREVVRVLRPGGRFVLVGFNPLSAWWLVRWRRVLRETNPVALWRLYDWLPIVGLERESDTVHVHYRGARSLALTGKRWQPAASWWRRLNLPFGDAYMIVATKADYATVRLGARRSPGRLVPEVFKPAAASVLADR